MENDVPTPVTGAPRFFPSNWNCTEPIPAADDALGELSIEVNALADLLADAPPFARSGELVVFADDAPTLHVYVRDVPARCAHRAWRDPGAEEWADVLAELAGPSIVR